MSRITVLELMEGFKVEGEHFTIKYYSNDAKVASFSEFPLFSLELGVEWEGAIYTEEGFFSVEITDTSKKFVGNYNYSWMAFDMAFNSKLAEHGVKLIPNRHSGMRYVPQDAGKDDGDDKLAFRLSEYTNRFGTLTYSCASLTAPNFTIGFEQDIPTFNYIRGSIRVNTINRGLKAFGTSPENEKYHLRISGVPGPVPLDFGVNSPFPRPFQPNIEALLPAMNQDLR